MEDVGEEEVVKWERKTRGGGSECANEVGRQIHESPRARCERMGPTNTPKAKKAWSERLE